MLKTQAGHPVRGTDEIELSHIYVFRASGAASSSGPWLQSAAILSSVVTYRLQKMWAMHTADQDASRSYGRDNSTIKF